MRIVQTAVYDDTPPLNAWVYAEIIPTRQAKPPSKLFCIGNLIPFGLIWYPLSKSLGVSDFLLSKIYQGLLLIAVHVKSIHVKRLFYSV